MITGASGFVGSRLASRLVGDGWNVHIVVRPQSRLVALESTGDRLVKHVFDGSIESMTAIVGAAKPDVVFHLASLYLAMHEPKDIRRLIESNLLFGTLLLEAMAAAGAGCLVNTGTTWQHYKSKAYDPVCLYAATKQAFEAILQYYVEATPLKTITLKLCDIYGPGDHRNKVLQLLLKAATSRERLAMSPGEQRIDFVHVQDVVEAYVSAGRRMMEGKTAGHETYAVTSGQAISLRELVRSVECVIETPLPIDWGGRRYRRREVMHPWLSGIPLPGWSPQIRLEEGIRTIFNPGSGAAPRRSDLK